jgi:hypothetical protein
LIPPGWIDELQPLDRYVFGALKSMCRRLFQTPCQEDDARLKRPDAVGFLLEAWGIYEDVLGNPDDDDDLDDRDWQEFPGGLDDLFGEKLDFTVGD